MGLLGCGHYPVTVDIRWVRFPYTSPIKLKAVCVLATNCPRVGQYNNSQSGEKPVQINGFCSLSSAVTRWALFCRVDAKWFDSFKTHQVLYLIRFGYNQCSEYSDKIQIKIYIFAEAEELLLEYQLEKRLTILGH